MPRPRRRRAGGRLAAGPKEWRPGDLIAGKSAHVGASQTRSLRRSRPANAAAGNQKAADQTAKEVAPAMDRTRRRIRRALGLSADRKTTAAPGAANRVAPNADRSFYSGEAGREANLALAPG